MDPISLGLPDWPLLARLAEVPDTVWSAFVAAVLTLALVAAFLPRREPDPLIARAEDATACDFLINGASVRPVTAAARALLGGFGAGSGAPLQGLIRHLARDCASIQDDLEGLILFGEGFRRHCSRSDGSSYEVLGAPQGAAVLLSIRPASAEARALDAAERALARARGDVAFQRDALDRAPIMIWTLAPDGTVTWANASYRDRFAPAEPERIDHRPPNVFAHLLEEVPLTPRDGCESRRRVKIADPLGGDPHWFEISQLPLPSGETLTYAIGVNELVAAEASLRRFVETLTETFAHLPIGLAVFDKNRRLGLFNPALSDLVKIDAVWLAGRPSLRDFLERLRETRQMPEQKDFAAFRRMLTTLEEGARDGTYEENWQLPSGKIFRVTGRPHPQGALAFLFEDISTAIQLERRYRSELELSQATLDRIGEAVAVFDTSGMLVFVNSAFEALWGLEPMEGLEGPAIGELTEIWAGRCVPSPIWSDVADFATGAEARTSWSAGIETLRGEPLQILVAPLPTGSTLVTFRDRRGVARDPGTDAAPIEARAVAPTGAQPTAVPTGAQPTAAPTGAQPTAVPTGAQPTAVPTGAQPTAVPTGAQPTAVPTGAHPGITPPGAHPSAAPTAALPAAPGDPLPLPAAPPKPARAPAGLAEAALLGDLALAELELPAEAALRSLATAIGTAPDHAAFAALSSAAQALKDGLARARALQAAAEAALGRDDTPAALGRPETPAALGRPEAPAALGRDETPAATAASGRPADPASRLAALLALRGLTLGPVHDPVPDTKEAAPETPGEATPADADRIARALPPLAFALASLAAPGATVDLALGRDPAVVALRAPAGPAAPEASDAGDEPPVLALARRRLAALGATLEVAREDGRIALAARFPALAALAPPAADPALARPAQTPSTPPATPPGTPPPQARAPAPAAAPPRAAAG
jgi:PAS domain-containing protein